LWMNYPLGREKCQSGRRGSDRHCGDRTNAVLRAVCRNPPHPSPSLPVKFSRVRED